MVDFTYGNSKGDIATIKSRNRQQTRWISIAAFIVLLIGVGVTTFFLHNGNLTVDVPKDISENSTLVEKDNDESAASDNTIKSIHVLRSSIHIL